MKRIFLLFLALCSSMASIGQTITAVEYFFDADPGAGAGTSVPIVAGATVDKSFDVSITAITNGFHTLNIRAKDVNNRWSITSSKPLYKISGSGFATSNITKLEYFIDADPGAGAATDVPITAGLSVSDLQVIISLGSVTNGFHTLTFRSLNANGRWSVAQTVPFYKFPFSLLSVKPNITKLEYFVDADPGAGLGTNVPITAGLSVSDLQVMVSLTTLTNGFHSLTFRSQDANGRWSMAMTKPFYKIANSALTVQPNITKLEYFIDTDPGPGAGVDLPVTAATSITDYAFEIDVAAVSIGAHKMSIRALDANGKWSIVYTANFGVFAPPPVGQPTNLSITAVTSNANTVTFTPPAAAPVGYIAVRKIGSAPTTDPADGTVYTKNQTLGDGVVAYVGTAATFSETGLTPTTQYFYKIYAYNGATTTINYLTTAPPLAGNFTTLALPVIITAEVLPNTYNKGGTLTASITVNTLALAKEVKIKYRGITDAVADLKSLTITSTTTKFERVFSATELTDGVGIKYYFEVTGQNTEVISSKTGTAYVKYTATDAIPNLSFGGKPENYQIIAIPMNLADNKVTTVFSELGEYKNTKWRLYDFFGGDNREYPGFSTIDAGKGYWLIARNSAVIAHGVGNAVAADDATPFTITLVPGWNLIGNPYNFKVSWDDVLAASGAPVGLSQDITLFSNGELADGNVIEAYRGGFVKNTTTNPIQIKVPTLRNKTINGGRTSSVKEIDLASNEWILPISVSKDGLINTRGGVGMHPMASGGKDVFDIESVPLLEGIDMPELSFARQGIKSFFNKDIVPRQENFTWQFESISTGSGPMQLHWPAIDKKGDRQLVLLDVADQRAVDMTQLNTINVSANSKNFKVIFGDKSYMASVLDKELEVIGKPYPNPARDEVNIPFYITEALDNSNVSLKIYDTLGKEVATLADTNFGKGSHVVSWQPNEPPGMYIVTINVGLGIEKRVKVILQ
jgi:Secretion system C-terminal sorting domain